MSNTKNDIFKNKITPDTESFWYSNLHVPKMKLFGNTAGPHISMIRFSFDGQKQKFLEMMMQTPTLAS